MEMCNRHIFPQWRNYEESKGRKCLTGICRKKMEIIIRENEESKEKNED